jgi:hypothetical protein
VSYELQTKLINDLLHRLEDCSEGKDTGYGDVPSLRNQLGTAKRRIEELEGMAKHMARRPNDSLHYDAVSVSLMIERAALQMLVAACTKWLERAKMELPVIDKPEPTLADFIKRLLK